MRQGAGGVHGGRMVVAIAASLVAAAGCTTSIDVDAGSTTHTTIPIATVVTTSQPDISTTAAPPGTAVSGVTFTTLVASDITGLSDEDLLFAYSWFSGEYQSPNYACTDDSGDDCGPSPRSLRSFRFLGTEVHDESGIGCLEFDITASSPGDYPGDQNFAVRIVQLDEAPALPIGAAPVSGRAWLEVTFADISAVDRAEAASPDVFRNTASEAASPITEIVLLDSNESMMRWIVGLDDPGEYHFRAFETAGPAAWIHIRKAPAESG